MALMAAEPDEDAALSLILEWTGRSPNYDTNFTSDVLITENVAFIKKLHPG